MTQPLHHLITSTKPALLIERKLTTLLCFWVVPFRRICTQLPSAGLSWIMPDQFLTSTTNNSLHHGKVAHVNKHVIQQHHQLNQTRCHKTYICIVLKNQHKTMWRLLHLFVSRTKSISRRPRRPESGIRSDVYTCTPGIPSNLRRQTINHWVSPRSHKPPNQLNSR